jgi:hypothetical protein
MTALGNAPLPVVYDPAETLILRDKDGNNIDYRETAETRRRRRNLAIINEAVGSAVVAHPDLGEVVDGTPVQLGKANAGPAKRTLHRVYTEDWDRHGRFYGHWWQNIPKGERARLTLNGEPIFTADYPRLHITLAYAKAGVPLHGDPYEIGSWPVSLVKVVVNIILNAKDRTSALRAVAQHIGGQGAFAMARLLLEDIERRHAPIEDSFYSNAGLGLMNTDSGMAEGVLLTLIKRGSVALPLHDEFGVEDSRRGDLLEAMAAELHRVLNQGVSHCGRDEITPSVLHMVPPSSPSPLPGVVSGEVSLAAPVVLVVLPVDDRQGDFFGVPLSGVPAQDVFSWERGVVPESVQKALQREIRRRGLRQDEAAAAVGVSRPQLANGVSASPPVAARIRKFLLSEAVTVKAGPNRSAVRFG